MQPDTASLWARMALLRLTAGHATRGTNPAAAITFYETSVSASRRALELEPRTGSYLNNLADALARLDRLTDALSSYDQAITSGDGQAALYHSNRGIALTKAALREQDVEVRRARLREANAAFDAAVRLDPTLAEAFFQRAVNQMSFAELRKGRVSPPSGTVESLQRYLELAPEGKHAAEARDLIAQLKK
jgi:tetratricopeptide (TPR) repeat protein